MQPWARAFWPMAVVHDAGVQLRTSVAALFAAASPDVVDALCQAHPVLDSAVRSGLTLMELMSLLPPIVDAAACRAAVRAAPGSCDAKGDVFRIAIDNDSTPELCARAVSQLRALGVREVALAISASKDRDHAAPLRAVEPLLAQLDAPGGMPLVQLTLEGTVFGLHSLAVDRATGEAALVALLPRCKAGLRSLHVWGAAIRLSSTVVEAIAMLHSLEHLELPHFEPSRVPAEAVMATLPALPRLRSLDIQIDGSTAFWTSCIAQMTDLQALSVHLTLDGLKASQIGAATVHLHALTRLSLSGGLDFGYDSDDGDDSDDEGLIYRSAMPALRTVMASVPNLQHLDLSDLTTGGQEDRPSAVALDLCAAIAGAALPALTRLDLCASNVALGWEDLQPVCAHLAALTRLRELHLSRNPIKDSGAARLVPCLAEVTSLQSLGLSRCDIGPAGVAALAPALRQLAHLTRLDLSHNRGGSAECAEPLARELGMRAAGGVLSSLKRGP